MKAFVTGGTGFIGSRVIQKLVDRGDEVHALIRSQAGAQMVQALGAHPVWGDITAAQSMRAGMQGSDVAFHIAAWYKLGSSDQLKAMCAAIASSGAVALFHVIGVTPEANTLEEAFQDGQPEQVIDIHFSDLKESMIDLSSARENDKLDLVLLGCPHFSFEEFRDLAMLIQTETDKGKSLHPDVTFVVLSCQTSLALLQRSDYFKVLKEFGIQIALDTCVFHTPMVSQNTKVLMTNSGKCAYYAPGELGVQVAFGDMTDCVTSAIEGIVCRKESAWNES